MACDFPLRTVKVAARFGSVSTNPHITPAALLISAQINEQPTAIVCGATVQLSELNRRQQRSCRTDNRCEDTVERFSNVVPYISASIRNDAHAGCDLGKALVKCGDIHAFGSSLLDDCRKNAVDQGAQFEGIFVHAGSTTRLTLSRNAQRASFGSIDDARLEPKSNEISVITQPLDR